MWRKSIYDRIIHHVDFNGKNGMHFSEYEVRIIAHILHAGNEFPICVCCHAGQDEAHEGGCPLGLAWDFHAYLEAEKVFIASGQPKRIYY